MVCLEARGDARRRQRIAPDIDRGRQVREGGGGGREGEGRVEIVFRRRQYVVGGAIIMVLVLVLFLGRLAGNPPFLLGRRGESELPVQLSVDGIGGGKRRYVVLWRW